MFLEQVGENTRLITKTPGDHATKGSDHKWSDTIRPLEENVGDSCSSSSFHSFDDCESSWSITKESNTQNHKTLQASNTKSSLRQTAVNIGKMCMGTGTLGLPFAASQGGYLFNMIGLGIIMLWNIYSVQRLLHCLDYLPIRKLQVKNQNPSMIKSHSSPDGPVDDRMENTRDDDDSNVDGPYKDAPTFEKVAWYAFGPLGVKIIDGISLCLYFGIITAYIDAMLGFLCQTPFTTGTKSMDGLLVVLVLLPFASVSELKFLAKYSAMGIFVLLSIYVIIAIYAISMFGLKGFTIVSWEDMGPTDLTGISNWFGIVSFSMGVVPFTYNIQESMDEPSKMSQATELAVWFIYATYIVISDGIAILFSPSTGKVDGDVLEMLPRGWIPTFVRMAMTLVIAVTTPLIVIPAGEMIEAKLGFEHSSLLYRYWRILVRLVLLILCACISVMIRNFVHVISFVGCVCVALMSFVYPPLVHLVTFVRYGQNRYQTLGEVRCIVTQDIFMLVWGCFATIFTSILTFISMRKAY